MYITTCASIDLSFIFHVRPISILKSMVDYKDSQCYPELPVYRVKINTCNKVTWIEEICFEYDFSMK